MIVGKTITTSTQMTRPANTQKRACFFLGVGTGVDKRSLRNFKSYSGA